jgi:ankyrin repeat protein
MHRINQELFDATEENNLPEIRRLLRAGADMNAKTYNGDRPLLRASLMGYVQVVEELLDHGADIELTDNVGSTPLHRAASEGHFPVVKTLRSRGADIEARDTAGATPLHEASLHNHLAVVKAFLSDGANILAANNEGEFPVHYAVLKGHSAVSKYLLQQFYATICRLPLHGLLKDVTWIGTPNSNILDMPPLRYALHRNVLSTDDVVEIIEYLVKRNPELVSSPDQDGSLPLHVACRRGAPFAIVESLANLYKASVKSLTSKGDFPLFLACEMPDTSLGTIFLLMKFFPDLVYR